MEDSEWLSQEDKNKLENLKIELGKLKNEHKKFAKNKDSLTPEDRERWKVNAQRTNQIFIEMKELRFKNVMNAGKA